MTHTTTLHIETGGFSDVRDLPGSVLESLRTSGIRDGIATVFVPGSPARITTIEYEEGAVSDLQRDRAHRPPHNPLRPRCPLG